MEIDERTNGRTASGIAPPVGTAANRWKVLKHLLAAGEQYVSEIARATCLPAGTVYGSLSALRLAGLVSERRATVDVSGPGPKLRCFVRLTDAGRRAAMALPDKCPARPLAALHAIRVARGLSRQAVAERGYIGIATAAGTENNADPRLSSLRPYVAGLGGSIAETVVLHGQTYTLTDREPDQGPEEIDGHPAATLASLRIGCGFSLRALASRSGLGLGTVTTIEKGGGTPGERQSYVAGLGGQYVLAIVFPDGTRLTPFASGPQDQAEDGASAGSEAFTSQADQRSP
jgi:transcriptional regulator with XRE-family HTH domain